MNIDKFINAVNHYKKRGYVPIQLPYYASNAAIDITIPKDRVSLPHGLDNGYVGSAEQSFIDRILQKAPLRGCFMAFTPCYRDEEEISTVTQLIFSKLELYSTKKSPTDICTDVISFIGTHYNKEINIVKTDIGIDLVYNDVEIGSFGDRTINGITYCYGTGITFPRYNLLD